VQAKVVAFNEYGDSLESDVGNGAVIITYADAPTSLSETIEARQADRITFSWSEGAANGGSPVFDYRISSDQATGDWIVVATGIQDTSYTAIGLTAGLYYSFKVEAQNAFGYSAFSPEVSILCATVPEKPNTPTTTVVGSNVIFDWDAPNDNGTPINEYKILIRNADSSFVQDDTVCNGKLLTVVQNTECTVPLSKLTASPFNLLRGYSIFIKVIAQNPYGDSLASDQGNGGIIVLVPDSPVNLQNDLTVTTASVIKFTWSDGVQDGGTSIIDYRVSYDQSTGNFEYLATGVQVQEYTTDFALEAG